MYGLTIPSSDDDDDTDELTDTEWYTPRQQSEAREAASPSSHTSLPPLPTELWEMVMRHLQRELVDDSFTSVSVLLNCALVCRTWAGIALPLLYKTHGYGVFLPLPATRDSRTPLFPTSGALDSPATPATKRHLTLWRTLLLSLFTCSTPTPARFAHFPDAALFPYISYVPRLDLRSLLLVLRAIAHPPQSPPAHRDEIRAGAAEYFLAGALGAFEISGEARGRRMIVGGPEYRVSSPVEGKELRMWTGDTALMMLDFLYQHISHLEAVTIPELGELRVREPLGMGHPVGMLSSLTNLRSLVISSGWMLSRGLGAAIARLRPPITDGETFALTILDWRHKTSYAVHSSPPSPPDDEPFRHTIRSTLEFLDALAPDSITTLSLSFEGRVAHPHTLLAESQIPLRQARSLRALRLSHVRLPLSTLLGIFLRMAEAGFRPRALSLADIHPASPAPWDSSLPAHLPRVLRHLEALELTRIENMFPLLGSLLQNLPGALHTLSLTYTPSEVRNAAFLLFFTRGLRVLAERLRVLRLVDTAHNPHAGFGPSWRMEYPTYGVCGLGEFAGLETLVLVGDVAAGLIGDGLEEVLRGCRALKTVDLSVSRRQIDARKLRAFAGCRKLERLMLREWAWDERGGVGGRKLTVEDVKGFLDRCAVVRAGLDGGVRVLEELGIAGGLLEVAGGRNWGELREWAAGMGTRFEWNASEMAMTP